MNGNDDSDFGQQDPFLWHAGLAFAFLLACLVRLTIPSTPYFDEVHYLPAARAMLALEIPINKEHPLLGKEFMALGIALFGDRPFGWRIFSVLAGVLALFAFMRAMWWASLSRYASIAGGLLLATGFALLVHAQIAMLDIYMVAFMLLALWLIAAALRQPARARWLLAGAGTAMGIAMAGKWNAVPVAMVPGIAFLLIRAHQSGARLLTDKSTGPVTGMTLIEAGLWLGAMPLLVYALTYVPAMFYENDPLTPFGLLQYHREMLAMQESVKEPHPYMSTWPAWATNTRAIWYLYEPIDGAQRGVLLVGNPATMLLGLPAMVWCAWVGFARQNRAALAVFALYAVSLGMWIFANKPVQFYYHYFLPSCFLLAGLALALNAMRERWGKWIPGGVLALSVLMFVNFWPILTAAPLTNGTQSFLEWTWIDGWK